PRFADGYRGSRWFPGLADGHLRETSSFRTCPRSSRANQWFPRLDDQHLIYSGFTWSSLQSAQKYYGLRSSRRAASARLPPVFCKVLSISAFCEAFTSIIHHPNYEIGRRLPVNKSSKSCPPIKSESPSASAPTLT